MDQNRDELLRLYEEMIMTQGWKNFVQNMRENKESVLAILMHKDSTERELQYHKGRNEVYDWIINFEEQIKLIKEHIKNEETI